MALYLLLMMLFSVIIECAGEEVDVETGLGTVRGASEDFQGTPLQIFKSIPFAQPPVGDLRFKAPQSVEAWDDVLDVTQSPDSCIQTPDEAFDEFPGVSMWVAQNKSEDCLYLSIWTPSIPDDQGTRDPKGVLVWIYGGGYWSGTTTLDIYDGRSLAAYTDMVVVSMQYRVGSLGFMFMDHPDAPGNQGLLDQVMALQWIQDHISHFGGDPTRVTLFGESAGASSVSNHLISPMSRDLFHRAIMQSGTALCRWAFESPRKSMERYKQLTYLAGCDIQADMADIMTCLRGKDAELINDLIWSTDDYNMITPVMATVDGEFLIKPPMESVMRGEMKDTEILLGNMKDEGSYYFLYGAPELFDQPEETDVTKDKFNDMIRTIAPKDEDLLVNAIKFEYEVPTEYGNMELRKDILDDVIGDADFICPSTEFAAAYVRQGNTVYMYHYQHVSSQNPWPTWLGAMHGYEIDSVFGVPLIEEDDLEYTEAEVTLSERMMTYWKNFAMTGDPNPEEPFDVTWDPHTIAGREYIEIRADDPFTMNSGLRFRQCLFWNHYLKEMQNMTREEPTREPEPCVSSGPPTQRAVHPVPYMVITVWTLLLVLL